MIRDWVKTRDPRVPEPFRPFLDASEPPSVEGLVTAARRELGRSLQIEAGDRHGAFALLAADAYLTYACERAVEDGGGPAELKQVLSRLLEGMP